MLDQCARGHTRSPKTHHWVVTFNALTYHTLPKGAHGKNDPEIEIGHVKKMVKFLNIGRVCANGMLPILRMPVPTPDPPILAK